MRLFVWIILCLSSLPNSTVWAQAFTIKGRITNLANQPVRLIQLDEKEAPASTKTDLQGNFTFTGQTAEISRAVITWSPTKGIPLVLSPQQIQIDTDSTLANPTVHYNLVDYSKIYQQYQAIENSFLKSFKVLEERRVNAAYRNHQDSIAYYSSQISDLSNTALLKLQSFLLSGQPKGMEGLLTWQASGLIGWRDQFSFFTDIIKIASIKGIYKQKIIDYLSHSQLVGQQIPSITLTDQHGRSYDLATLNEKYILLDFWASWCGPCVAQFPALSDLVKKYPEKVVLVSLSIDEDKARWLNALKKHPTNWLQCLDQDQPQSLKTYFKVGGIPDYILVAPVRWAGLAGHFLI